MTTLRSWTLALVGMLALTWTTPAWAMRDMHGMLLGPEVGDPAAIRVPGFNASEFDRVTSNPRLQYSDGMNLYQYTRANPVTGLDPSGLWSYRPFAWGSFDATIGPGPTPASSDFILTFVKNRALFAASCCQEIRFVQIHWFNHDFFGWMMNPVVSGAKQRKTWHLDADSTTAPYYPNGIWTDPRKSIANSFMIDAPGIAYKGNRPINISKWTQKFEVCAVCSKPPGPVGNVIGEVYGCTTWSHDFTVTVPAWGNDYVEKSWSRSIGSSTWSSAAGNAPKNSLKGFPGFAPSADMQKVLNQYFP